MAIPTLVSIINNSQITGKFSSTQTPNYQYFPCRFLSYSTSVTNSKQATHDENTGVSNATAEEVLTEEQFQTVVGDQASLFYEAYQKVRQHFLADLDSIFSKAPVPNCAKIFEDSYRQHDFKYPLLDRESAIHSLRQIATKQLRALEKKSQVWSMASIYGGSGVGKTRLSFDARSLIYENLSKDTALKTDEKYLMELLRPGREGTFDIFVKLTNMESIPDHLKHNPKQYLLCLLLHRLVDSSQNLSCTLVRFAGVSLNEQAVLRLIRAKQFPDITKPLVIVLRVDEIQMLMQSNLSTYAARPDKERTPLYKFVDSLMTLAIEWSTSNVLIIPIFSGTLSLKLLRLFPEAKYNVEPIAVSGLPFGDAISLIGTHLEGQNIALWEKEREAVKHLVMSLGGLPRPLSWLTEILLDNRHIDLRRVVAELHEALLTTYKLNTLTPEELNKILFAILSGRSIDDLAQDEFIADCLQEGTLFVSNTKQVMVPLLFLDFYLSQSKELLRAFPFLQKATVAKGRHWVDYEGFVAEFFAFKQNVFLATGHSQTTFAEFFCGATMHPKLYQQKLLLGNKKMKVYQASGQNLAEDVLSTTLLDTEQTTIKDIGEPIAVKVSGNFQYDTALIFPNAFIKVRFKVFTRKEGQVTFASRKTKSGFVAEQQKALETPNLPKKSSHFLYVTNGKLSITKPALVAENTIYSTQAEWEPSFSTLFW